MIFTDDVLFCHIPKTGGISTRVFIAHNIGGTDFQLHDSPFPDEHVPLRDVERWTGRPLDSFGCILAVVREPYEHALSQWVHWRDGYARGGRHACEMTAAVRPTLDTWLTDPYCHFGYFYERQRNGLGQEDAHAKVFGMGYYEYWLRVGDDFPANLVVVPFESLEQGVVSALIDHLPEQGSPFPHVNQSVQRDAKQYCTSETMERIHHMYRWAFHVHYGHRSLPGWT